MMTEQNSKNHPSLSYSFFHSSKKLDYGLLRNLCEQANQQTINLLKKGKIEIILPYGFELLKDFYPEWPKRHYPIIGYQKGSLSEQTINHFVLLYKANLIELLRVYYPAFYSRLKYIGIHNGSRYSRLIASDNLFHVNFMFIQLVSLSSEQTVLDHYSNYLMTVFNALAEKDINLPEIREFEQSKTRRNRLFQLFLICESLITHNLTENAVPAMSHEEAELYQALFNQLKIQNPSELVLERSVFPLPVQPVELSIRDQLIFPRAKLFKNLLQSHDEDEACVLVKAIPYYNGNHIISFKINARYKQIFQEKIKQTYLSFPNRARSLF